MVTHGDPVALLSIALRSRRLYDDQDTDTLAKLLSSSQAIQIFQMLNLLSLLYGDCQTRSEPILHMEMHMPNQFQL